jgi:hypothetical protein
MAVSGLLALVLLLISGCVADGTPIDLLTLIEPADYFAARRVEVTATTLLELAAGSPIDARGEARQLLALRWLGENKGRLGEQREAVRLALDRLARGPDGFAADYARIALARIDGTSLPAPRAAPKYSLRDALTWFPKDVSLVGVVDTCAPAGAQATAAPDAGSDRLLRRLSALYLNALSPNRMNDTVREEFYRFVEGVGNLRLDRLAFGFAADAGSAGQGRLFLRATGRMDHKRLAATLREDFGGDAVLTERKGLRGEPITTIIPREYPPGFVLIGDTEFVLAGYTSDSVNCARIIEEILAVRDGGRPGLLSGPLGKTLRDIPAEARGLLRGSAPRDVLAALARSPIGVAPEQMAVDVMSSGGGVELRFRGTFDNEADAKQFATSLRDEVKQAVEALKELPLSLQLLGIATIRKDVERIEVDSDGLAAIVKVPISAAALKALLGLLEGAISPPRGSAPNGG